MTEANEIQKKTFLKTKNTYLAFYDILHLSNADGDGTHAKIDELPEEGLVINN